MAEYLVQGESITEVADAIREKGGTTAPLSFPVGMAEAVRNIQSGGGAVTSVNGKPGAVTLQAVDVGATSQHDLQNATNEALALAKASGEFDGPQGPVGPQGPKGDTGPQGPAGADGYTPVKGTDYFTESDKTELVNAVLAALPNGNEVAY